MKVSTLILTLIAALAAAACSSSSTKTPDAGSASDAAVPTDSGLVQRIKAFQCDPSAVTKTTEVSKLQGTTDGVIAIKPTSQPCLFDLVVRVGGKDEVISSKPGGYLLTAGRSTASGGVVVCASNIDHAPVGSTSGRHQIRGVTLECAVKSGGTWTALATLAGGGDQWAAWIHEVQASATDTSRFTVSYKRDFSFQFLNLAEKGRPTTDGIYKTEFRLSGGELQQAQTSKAAGKVWDPQDVTHTGGDITDADRKRFAPYLDKSPDKCPPPNGCKLP